MASCSVTLGIGHGKRQERWGSNVYDVRLCLPHCSQNILFYSKQEKLRNLIILVFNMISMKIIPLLLVVLIMVLLFINLLNIEQ